MGDKDILGSSHHDSGRINPELFPDNRQKYVS